MLATITSRRSKLGFPNLILTPVLDRDAERALNDRKIKTLNGARKVSNVNRVIKGHGVWSQVSWWPLTSEAGPGTGATAYNLGGGAGGDMTHSNGPLWSAAGLVYDSASSQYSSIPDFIGSETLTAWVVASYTASADSSLIAQWGAGANLRSWAIWTNSSPNFGTLKDTNGTGTTLTVEPLVTNLTPNVNLPSAARKVYAGQWADSIATKLYYDNAEQSLVVVGGHTSPKPARFNTDIAITVGCQMNSGVAFRFADMTSASVAIALGTITDAARASISNALARL